MSIQDFLYLNMLTLFDHSNLYHSFRMYALYLLLILLFCIHSLHAQAPIYTFNGPGITLTDSTQGNNLPAYGQLHVLHVYARFQNDEEVLPGIEDWPVDRKKVPDYAYQWLAQNHNQMPEGSLSAYFKEASLGRFIYTGDVYPEVIVLDSSLSYYHTHGGYGAVTSEIIRKLDASGKVDWRRYDNWSRAGKTWVPEGDKMIDHIAVILRCSPANIDGKYAWLGSGGGIASLQGGVSWVRDSFYVHGGSLMSGLIVNGGGTGDPKETMKTLKHETAHFLTLHHYSATNDQNGGPDLVSHGGWGLASASGSSSICVNSWDRNFLSWAAFSKTFDPLTDVDCYVHLHDFVTTGAAIRIQVPYADQEWFLLEFHANKGMFDRVDQDVKGLYITHQSAFRGPHHLDVEEADGRYDYELIDQVNTQCCGKHWRLRRLQPNPLLGYGDRDIMQLDKDGNKRLDRNDALSVPVFMVDREEPNEIIHYLGDGGDGFIPRVGRNQFGIDTNPSSASNGTKLRSAISHLNGIRIQVISMTDSTIYLKLNFQDFNMRKSVRWCGQIEVRDSLTFHSGVDLLLDKSLTFIRQRDTFPGAHMTLKQGAVMHLTAGNKITIQPGCSLKLEKDAKIYLNKGSQIIVKSGGAFHYNPHQVIIRDKKSKIVQ
jgi:M6 family metalloprotease-like protein